MQPVEFFASHELACKGSGVIKLDPRFTVALEQLRRDWGLPLVINSCCRSPEHNSKVGGHPRSLHLTENKFWPTFGTMACDISWHNWSKHRKEEFCKLALSQGWRVGLNDRFVHIDRGRELGINTFIFTYGSNYSGDLHEVLNEKIHKI